MTNMRQCDYVTLTHPLFMFLNQETLSIILLVATRAFDRYILVKTTTINIFDSKHCKTEQLSFYNVGVCIFSK